MHPAYERVEGPVAPALDDATHLGVLWQARRGRYLLDVPDVARYLVKDGARITVDAAPHADCDEVERYLDTTPLAALHLQRGEPVLHAAWVVPPGEDRAVVLAGDSATGKSTLAAALWQRGWSVGADDLTAITLDNAGRPVAVPSARRLVLWRGTLERLGDPPWLPYGPDGARHAVDCAPRVVDAARPVRSVWRLGRHNKGEVDSGPIVGMARFRALSMMAYNSHVADALLDRAAFMRVASAFDDVEMQALTMPTGRWSADEAADLIAAPLLAPDGRHSE